MIAETFLDTSILLHAASAGRAAPAKHEIAQGLLTTPFGTSAQVLSEFYSAATQHGPSPLPAQRATRWIELLAQKPVQPVDGSIALLAIARAKDLRISYWDAAIIAAAEKLGCSTIYSEDLAPGLTHGSVRVVNPFVEDTSSKEG